MNGFSDMTEGSPRAARIASVLFGALLALATPASAGDGWPSGEPFAPETLPALEEAERERLAGGEVLIRELEPSDGEGIGMLTMAFVEASVEAVWAVMADCEEQDEFIPRVLHAEVRDREGDLFTCDLQVDLPFPFEDPRTATRHRVVRLPDGGYQRRWKLADGDDASYARNRGSWTVHPFEGGALIIARMDLLPKTVLPLWLIEAAQTQQAPETYAAIRERVASESGGAPR